MKSLLYVKARQKMKMKKLNERPPKLTKIKCTKICRICNEIKGTVNMFKNSLDIDIPMEIKSISGVEVEDADTLSKHICENCLELLKGCLRFRDMCRNNTKLLIDIEIIPSDKLKRKSMKTIRKAAKKARKKMKADEWTGKDDWGAADTFDDGDYDGDETYNVANDEKFNKFDGNNFVPANIDINERFKKKDTLDDDFFYEEKIRTCKICRERFYDMEIYKRHLDTCKVIATEPLQIVEDGKKTRDILCDTCGQQLRSLASFKSHLTTHTNIFPFACNLCPYKGRTIDLLKVHKRTHMEVKPYRCTLCPQNCSTASNLTRHIQHMHSTDRPHKCPYCDRRFVYERDVAKHVKEMHLRQNTSECPICHKVFATRKIMRGHRLKVHKVRGERTGRLPSYLQCQQDAPKDRDGLLSI